MNTSPDLATADLALLRLALDWHADGHRVAIASVVDTWGSAPCPAGSQLVIREDMRFEGSVSGGCVESAVIQEAVDLLRSPSAGDMRRLTYGVSDAQAFEVGLACGGRVEVLLQRVSEDDGAGHLSPSLLRQALECVQERRAVVLAWALADGSCELHYPNGPAPAGDAALAMAQRAALAARDDRSGRYDDHHLKVLNPRLRLVIVGAVHVAQHLTAMAQRCNYEVVVIDPREAFLRERFDHVQTLTHWPDQALHALALDRRTAVVTLTHDPKLDDPALAAALGSEAFYVGALGSRRTQASRRDRLAEHGVDAAQLARIHGPVGLHIGARGPAEIAVSILAEITATLRTQPTVPSPVAND